ncbi:MAG: SufD family Fe-S cluster assembly protein [Bacilli bacterium]|nr:SufD family Fe-S cluster assembly protein [Bacilli bacterium]
MIRSDIFKIEHYQADNFLYLNLNNLNLIKDNYQINIPSNVHINLLIEGGYAGILSFFVEENSKMEIAYATLDEIKDLNLQFFLAKDAYVQFGMADFSHGTGQVTVLFNLNASGAHAQWKLSSLAREKDFKTFTVSFAHYAPHTYSNMENYGVVTDKSRLRFLGTSHIYEDGHRAEAHQTAKIMVFDEHCIAQAEPVLKIDHNDVIASHAASVGKVNDAHLFYLCSRGLSLREAKNLITVGYLKPIINSFSDEELQNRIRQIIEEQEAIIHD